MELTGASPQEAEELSVSPAASPRGLHAHTSSDNTHGSNTKGLLQKWTRSGKDSLESVDLLAEYLSLVMIDPRQLVISQDNFSASAAFLQEKLIHLFS